MDKLNAAEAVYGFCAWLTSRRTKTVMSSTNDSACIATLVKEFCETNSLDDVTEDWPKNLKHPKLK